MATTEEQFRQFQQERGVGNIDADSFKAGIARGVKGVKASAGGFTEVVGEAVDSKELMSWGKEVRDKARQEAALFGKSSSPQLLDAETSDDFLGFAKEAIAQAIPSLGVTGGGTAAGAVIGTAIAPGPGTVIGAVAGALLSSGIVNTGEVQNAVKEIHPEESNPLAVIATGTGLGALDAIGFGKIASPIVKRVGLKAAKAVAAKELAKRGVTSKVAEDIVKGVFSEGITEGAQEVLKTESVEEITDTEKAFEQKIKDTVDAIAAGGIAGGTIRGALGLRGAAFDTTIREDTSLTEAPSEEFSGEFKNTGEFKRALKGIASKPTDVLEQYRQISPTMGVLLDKFRESKLEGLTTDTMFSQQQQVMGEFNSAYAEATRGLSKKKINNLLKEYSEGDRSTTRHQGIARLFETIQQAGKQIVGTGKIKNFLPWHGNIKQITKDKQEFINDISPFVEDAPVKVDQWLKDMEEDFSESGPILGVADRIFQDEATLQDVAENKSNAFSIKQAINRVGENKPARFGHLEAQRQFSQVPQHIMNKWAKKDLNGAVQSYLQKSAERLVAAETFGKNHEKLNAMVAKVVLEASESGVKFPAKDIKRIYDIVDASNHTFDRIETNIGRNAAAATKTVATGFSLPLSLFSSLIEPFNIAMKADTSLMFRSMLPAIRNGARNIVSNAFSSVPISDFAKDMHSANITFSSTQNVMAQRMTDVATTKWSAGFNNVFFKMNGLAYWTHAMRVWSASAAEIQIKDDLDTVKSFSPNTRRGALAQARLNELGVDPVAYFRAGVEGKRAIRAEGVRRFVHETVLEPTFADRPLWMSSGKMSVLAQLKGYPTMFTNTVLPNLANKLDFNKAGGYNAIVGALDFMFIVGGMLLVGAVQDTMKQSVKALSANFDDDRDEAEYWTDIVDRTVAPIHLSYLTGFFKADGFGSDPATSATGPVISLFNDTIRSMSKIADDGGLEELEKYLLKITPLRPWANTILE
jgi:hypothetical protein